MEVEKHPNIMSPESHLIHPLSSSSTAYSTSPSDNISSPIDDSSNKLLWTEGSFKQLPFYSKEIKESIIYDTNQFFEKNGIRILKHVFPLKLPDGFKDLEDIAAQGKEYPPYTSVYRHMYNLKQRILSNWSYIDTDINNQKSVRNQNMPFNLRPMTNQINDQLEMMAKDLNDSDFTGVLLTLHTARFRQVGFPEGQCLSKVLGGALVEGLVTNDRCIKAMWIHPNLSARSTRLILQAFIPRVILEAFELEVESDPSVAPPFKFVYAMHDDLDRWPRQAWLLMASSKKLGMDRHYESSNTPSHQVHLDFDAHIDAGVSVHTSSCQCQIEKAKKPIKLQGWLERLIGCTEQQMYYLAPSREDTKRLNIQRDKLGWRDFIPSMSDKYLIENIQRLEPGRSNFYEMDSEIKIDYQSDEWCGLDKTDLIDISSDTEIFNRSLRKTTNNNKISPKKKKIKRKSSVIEVTTKPVVETTLIEQNN